MKLSEIEPVWLRNHLKAVKEYARISTAKDSTTADVRAAVVNLQISAVIAAKHIETE